MLRSRKSYSCLEEQGGKGVKLLPRALGPTGYMLCALRALPMLVTLGVGDGAARRPATPATSDFVPPCNAN